MNCYLKNILFILCMCAAVKALYGSGSKVCDNTHKFNFPQRAIDSVCHLQHVNDLNSCATKNASSVNFLHRIARVVCGLEDACNTPNSCTEAVNNNQTTYYEIAKEQVCNGASAVYKYCSNLTPALSSTEFGKAGEAIKENFTESLNTTLASPAAIVKTIAGGVLGGDFNGTYVGSTPSFNSTRTNVTSQDKGGLSDVEIAGIALASTALATAAAVKCGQYGKKIWDRRSGRKDDEVSLVKLEENLGDVERP